MTLINKHKSLEIASEAGLKQFDRCTALEETLKVCATISGGLAICMLVFAIVGGGYDHEILAYSILPSLLLVLFLVIYYHTDNYYLVDPKEHIVYYHFKFLWIHSLRLAYKRNDINSVGTRGSLARSRYSTRWNYQVVLIESNGKVVPFSDWEKESLYECEKAAADLGRSLGCKVYHCPPEHTLRIKNFKGAPHAIFEPLIWGFTRNEWYLFAAIGIPLLLICLMN